MALLSAPHAAALQQLFTTSCSCRSANMSPPCCASAAQVGYHHAHLRTLHAPRAPHCSQRLETAIAQLWALHATRSQLRTLHAQLRTLHAARAHVACAHVTQHRFWLIQSWILTFVQFPMCFCDRVNSN